MDILNWQFWIVTNNLLVIQGTKSNRFIGNLLGMIETLNWLTILFEFSLWIWSSKLELPIQYIRMTKRGNLSEEQ